MNNSDELRMRLDAQVAARRAAAEHRPRLATRTDPVGGSGAVGSGALNGGPRGAGHGAGHGGGARSGGPGSSQQSVARSPSALTRLGSLPIRLLIIFVVAALCALGLRTYVVQPFWIPSQSMEPTLHGCPTCRPDRLVVDKLTYHLHSVHRGDVVVFRRPPGAPVEDTNLIKRVVGLAGEVVSATNGTVYVDNRALTEPYVAGDCHGTQNFAPVTVPRGEVFVMGDNRCDSLDSRVFGAIPTTLIVGRAVVIVWPLNRIHWL